MTETVTLPPRTPVVGIPISMTSYDEVVDVVARPPRDRALTVAVCNVHSVMSARRDAELRRAIEDADVATPDGVPLVWAIRLLTSRPQTRVYGPELMRRTLAEGPPGLRHYFYGATEETLARLQEAVRSFAPSAEIVGAEAPPFRPLSEEEEDAALARIRASGANVLWVGLGMPKQELWMHRAAPRLPGISILGVGAAFDFLAGTKPQAPAWMQRAGLEWLFRLATEPRRLWRRYVWNNPAYLVLLAAQVVRSRVSKERRAGP
ncbi:MAG TPA: glycosyltransferase [Actinobacteria bacterium]|nr:glycosyltransferase [Actinomycetota bacterium]